MNKKDVAQKMVQHTHYDRETKKLVRTMVPQTKEHAERAKEIKTHKSKPASDNEQRDYQRKTGRGYNE